MYIQNQMEIFYFKFVVGFFLLCQYMSTEVEEEVEKKNIFPVLS